MRGKIISGYQGVGKSTLAKSNNNYVDLESSTFFVEGVRDPNWHIVYINIAEHLALSGLNVFISAHKIVRDELIKRNSIQKILVYPSLDLKDIWVSNLKERYIGTLNTNEEQKNYKAFICAKERYSEDIQKLIESDGFDKHYIIKEIPFNLEYILNDTDSLNSLMHF